MTNRSRIKSPEPDAEQFGRTVLLHLAGLRAEIASLLVQLHDLQAALGRPVTNVYVEQCVERDWKSQMNIYLDACKHAKIDPDAGS